MSYYDKHLILLMNFTDYFVNELGYYVTNIPNSIFEIQKKRGYAPSNESEQEVPFHSVRYKFELAQLSREEISNYSERIALRNEDHDFGESTEELKDVLLQYFDDFVEDYFVHEPSDTQSKIKIHRGYRPKRRKGGSRPVSEYSVSFTAVQPSREEIEKHISFYISEHLKK